MNDHQIHCFLVAAEENNFTRAAERLYITQPAISKIISSLEKELGVPLFLRHSSKKISMTEAGRQYYNIFQHWQAEFENVQSKVNNLRKANLQHLRFAYASRWTVSDFLPRVLADMQEKFPHLSINMECLELNQILHDLLAGKLDMAMTFIDYFEDLENGVIEYLPVCQIQSAIVYSNAYVTRHGRVSRPEDFASATFYLSDSEQDRKSVQLLQEYCRPYGFVPHFQFMRNWDSVVAMVEVGQGVVVFDAWAQHLTMKQFHYVNLDSHHTIGLGWRREIPKDIADHMALNIRKQADAMVQ